MLLKERLDPIHTYTVIIAIHTSKATNMAKEKKSHSYSICPRDYRFRHIQ
jgi:hypothetical protein